MKKLISVIIILSLISLCSCGARGNTEKRTFFALDTVIEFKIYGQIPDGTEEYVKELEKIFSKTDPESELYTLNDSEGGQPSELLYSLIERSLALSADTKGAFDITAGALTAVWDEATEKSVPPDSSAISEAKANCGFENVRAENGRIEKPKELKFDLGAVAKGYIAELTVERLRQQGVVSGQASFGGSVALISGEYKSTFKIGVRSPDGDGIVGYTELSHGIVSTSGDYERYFEYEGKKYHHIIDTTTGMPSDSGIRSCTVISDDGAVSDALSTALFVNPALLDELYGKYDFEAILLTTDKKVITTANAGFVITANDYSRAER